MKKLHRSRENKIIFGIMGGLGEYLEIDPVVLRLVYVILLLISGVIPLTVAYLIAALIIPAKPKEEDKK